MTTKIFEKDQDLKSNVTVPEFRVYEYSAEIAEKDFDNKSFGDVIDKCTDPRLEAVFADREEAIAYAEKNCPVCEVTHNMGNCIKHARVSGLAVEEYKNDEYCGTWFESKYPKKRIRFQVDYHDFDNGATSPFDTITEDRDYTAEEYTEDLKNMNDDDYNKLLEHGYFILTKIDD